MMRKRSSSQFEQVKHLCRNKGYLPLHKFQGLALSDAIELVKNYLPEKQTLFPFTESADFEFGVEGIIKIMQNLPRQVTMISFNVRYLFLLEEHDLIALIKLIPEHLGCVMLNYVEEHNEFPAHDASIEVNHSDAGPNLKSLKMLVNTFNQGLRAGVELSYDFKKYGLEDDNAGLMRLLDVHGLFIGERNTPKEEKEEEKLELGK